MKTATFILFWLLALPVFAQDFEMDDSVKLISKPTNSSTPPHENFQFINNSGDSLPIRWRVNQNLTYYPSQWQLALQDNETYHNPIIDSNDIIIPDSAGTMDKIIINVFHNGFAGYGELVIDLINLDSVQEVHQIKFEIDIYEPHNTVSENDLSTSLLLFPNPANSSVTVVLPRNEIPILEVYSLAGQRIPVSEVIPGQQQVTLNIENLPQGCYLIRLVFPGNACYSGSLIKP